MRTLIGEPDPERDWPILLVGALYLLAAVTYVVIS